VSLSQKTLTASGDIPIHMVMAVTNTGSRAGWETVQIYVRDEKSALPRPEKELVAFEKVYLEPDETKHITVPLDKYAVGYYDDSLSAWIAEEGTFRVLVGASAGDVR
jgi:beta-glucosidase